MRLPLASLSDHRNSQTLGPLRRAFELRLPCCIVILPARSGGTGKIFSSSNDEKHPLPADRLKPHGDRSDRTELPCGGRVQLVRTPACVTQAAAGSSPVAPAKIPIFNLSELDERLGDLPYVEKNHSHSIGKDHLSVKAVLRRAPG